MFSFRNEQFVSSLAHISSAATTTDWEFVCKAEEFTISKRPVPGKQEIYEYRAIGHIASVSPEIACSVYMDTEYRKKYDTFMGDFKVSDLAIELEQDKNVEGHIILKRQNIECTVKYPWPMSCRLYVYHTESRRMAHEGRVAYVVKSESTVSKIQGTPNHEKMMANYPNHVLIDDFAQDWIFYEIPDNNGCGVIMTYYECAASYNSALMHWAIQRGIPGFIKNLRTACKEYTSSNSAKTMVVKSWTLSN